MIVPDDIRKCVVFIGAKLANGGYRMMGTAFFLGRDQPGVQKADPCYAVTARHVIDKMRDLGVTTLGLRMNTRAGETIWIDTPINEWVYSASDTTIDVAIREMGIPAGNDHLAVPYSMCITDALMTEHEIGPGDEVFVTGLFRHHHGSRKNIPIIRVGALACMGEERVATKFGDMEALLIEARSIGGLSGSPVFLHVGLARNIKGQLKFTSGQTFYLLGLIHGHYDAGEAGVDLAEDEPDDIDSGRLTNTQINTGIAIVVPFQSIDTIITKYEERKNSTPAFSGQIDFSPFSTSE